MKKICSFIINNRLYNIYDVPRIKGKESYVGKSQYDFKDIFIEIGTKEEMLLTLKHELVHVWLYENGHKEQGNEKQFTYEDLCEYAALSNNFVNKITDRYLKAKRYFYIFN